MVDDPASKAERLRACSRRIEVLEAEKRGEHERRAELIRSMRDDGASWRTIANAAGRSIARCVAIVAGG